MENNKYKMIPSNPLSLLPLNSNNIQSVAPSTHVNNITNIPLATLPNIDVPFQDLTTFKIPEIPHGFLNDLPLPPDLNKKSNGNGNNNNNNNIALMPSLPIPQTTNHQTFSSVLPLPSISNIHTMSLPTISTFPTIPTMPTMPTIPMNPTLPTTLALSPKKLSLPKMSQFPSDTNTSIKTTLPQSSPMPQILTDTAPQTPSTRNDKPQLSIPTPFPIDIASDPKSKPIQYTHQHDMSIPIPSALAIKPSALEIENKTQEILAMYGINNSRKRKRESNDTTSRPRRSKAATSKRKYSRRQPQIMEDCVSSEDDDESDEYVPDDLMDIHNDNHTTNNNNHNRNHIQNQSEEKNTRQTQTEIDIDKMATTTTTNLNCTSLPLGHPARIRYKDTMSEGFTEKYKNKKRAVCHRTWARSKKCKDCKITYPSADDYELHRMVYHSEGIQMIHECPVCSSQYNERRWLNRHVRNSHFKFMCKIDGHGVNHEGKSNAQLKKKKGKKAKPSDIDNICGYRFSSKQDLIAHQAIIHGVVNEYVQHSGKQGPTIQFMNGTDAKDIVIQRLVWKETPKKRDRRRKPSKTNEVNYNHNNVDQKDEEEMDDNHNHNDNHNNNMVNTDDMDDGASVCSDDLVLDLSDITQTLKGTELDIKDKKKISKKKKKGKSADKPKTKKKGKKKDKDKSKSPSTKKKKKKDRAKDKDKSKKNKNKNKKKDKKSSQKKGKKRKKDKDEMDNNSHHWVHSMIIATEPIVSTEPPTKKRKINSENVV